MQPLEHPGGGDLGEIEKRSSVKGVASYVENKLRKGQGKGKIPHSN